MEAWEQQRDRSRGDEDEVWEQQQIHAAMASMHVSVAFHLDRDCYFCLFTSHGVRFLPLSFVPQLPSTTKQGPGTGKDKDRPVDVLAERALASREGGQDVTFEGLQRKLKETLQSMREVHSSHRMHHERLVLDINELERQESEQQSMLSNAAARYGFFAETKAYTCNLLVCLDAKVWAFVITPCQPMLELMGEFSVASLETPQRPMIEEVESQMHVQLKQHRDRLRERRQHAMRGWRARVLQPADALGPADAA